MKTAEETDYLQKCKAFLESQGYEFTPNDDLWMEETISSEHSFRDICKLMQEYASLKEESQEQLLDEVGARYYDAMERGKGSKEDILNQFIITRKT